MWGTPGGLDPASGGANTSRVLEVTPPSWRALL